MAVTVFPWVCWVQIDELSPGKANAAVAFRNPRSKPQGVFEVLMYLYSAFGLKIESAITLSAPVAAGAPDVRIRLGATPGSLEDAELRAEGIEASPDQFLVC